MRTQTVLLLTTVLLLVALAPWIVSSCSSRPLMPNELPQQRSRYEATMVAAKHATIEAMRKGESNRQVIAIGTVAVTAVMSATTPITRTVRPTVSLTPTLSLALTATLTPTPTHLAEIGETPTAMITATQRVVGSSSVKIVRSTVLTTTPVSPTVASTMPLTPTKKIVIVHVDGTPVATQIVPVNPDSAGKTPTPAAGFVAKQDVLSEQMLTTQVQTDASDTTLSNLVINLQWDGVYATGDVPTLLGFKQPVEVRGNFAVEHDSLVFKATTILFKGVDVTEQYRGQLEERVNSSLYHLLPQRYVKSFKLGNGEVVVQSQMRAK